jgi:nucleoside-diphosphate-sugar epimerase
MQGAFPNTSMKSALVTGGTGFTGSNLIKRLIAENWQVHAIVRPESDYSLLDDCVEQITLHVHDGSTEHLIEIVAISKPDAVFHLAALFLAQHAAGDLVSLISNNITFSTQLAEAMAQNGVTRLINTGTSWQHYENREYAPTCLYAATKQAFETLLQYYVDLKGFEVITLKLFDSYGPKDPRRKLFKLLEAAVGSNVPLLMSPGDQLIDLVHIDDVIAAFIIAAERLMSGNVIGQEQYAVSSANPISLKEVVGIYEGAMNVKLPIKWGGLPYRNREVMVPWSGGKALPGWIPSISLANGIKTLIANN